VANDDYADDYDYDDDDEKQSCSDSNEYINQWHFLCQRHTVFVMLTFVFRLKFTLQQQTTSKPFFLLLQKIQTSTVKLRHLHTRA